MRGVKDRLKRLEEARRKLLEAQRQCAWCSFVAKSADELVEHILSQHPEDEQGNRH